MERVRSEPHLRRDLGLAHVSLVGVGIILGAGIYVLVGEAAGEAGALVWISFLLAALITAFTGLSYAELSAMFPRAGAGYEYTRQAFGITTGFLTGWLTIVAEIIAASAVALGFGGYLEDLTGIDPVVGAIGLLLAGVLIAASGALGSVMVAAVLTLVEAAGLIFVSSIGLLDFDATNLSGGSGTLPVLGGTALVFFAYIGFEDIATFSEEAKRPERTIPRAILISIAVSALLYAVVSITAVAAVGADELAGSGAPLALVAETVLNDRAGDFLAAIALAATGNTALLLLMAAGRRIYGMSATGALPPFLSRVSGTTGIPLTGLLVVAGIAAAFALRGDVGEAAELTNFALFIAFALVNSAVISLRLSQPEVRRPFRIPGSVPLIASDVPIVPVLGIGSLLLLVLNLSMASIVGGSIVMIVGLMIALWRRQLLRRRGEVWGAVEPARVHKPADLR